MNALHFFLVFNVAFFATAATAAEPHLSDEQKVDKGKQDKRLARVLKLMDDADQISASNESVDTRDCYGRTALYLALFHPYNYPDLRQAKKLIAQGADVNQRDTSYFRATLLHEAADRQERNLVTVRFLLQHGANKYAQDVCGKTPLDYAINQHNGFQELIDLLR